uniref:F-box domain-containing protein n=1 Tax=Oryza rufipogon TaxID=4529 RepID=A0A0E0PRY5_ORYRU
MDDVMSEILLRLPSKSVVRYRAVCRSWRRITSCPYFLAARDAGGILRRPPGAGAGPRPVRMLVHCSIWTARFVCVEERDDVMVVCESAHDKKLNTQHAAGLYHLRDNKSDEMAVYVVRKL